MRADASKIHKSPTLSHTEHFAFYRIDLQKLHDVIHVANFSHACVFESGRRIHIEPIMKIAPHKNGTFNFLFRHVSASTRMIANSDGIPKKYSGPYVSVMPPGNRAIAGGRKLITVRRMSRLWV